MVKASQIFKRVEKWTPCPEGKSNRSLSQRPADPERRDSWGGYYYTVTPKELMSYCNAMCPASISSPPAPVRVLALSDSAFCPAIICTHLVATGKSVGIDSAGHRCIDRAQGQRELPSPAWLGAQSSQERSPTPAGRRSESNRCETKQTNTHLPYCPHRCDRFFP